MSKKLATYDFVKKITDSRVGFIYLDESEINNQYPDIHKQGAFNIGFTITSDACAILGFYMSWIVLQIRIKSGEAVKYRQKYGGSEWTSWTNL